MQTAAITYHETHGTPPRLFHVTFELSGERTATVSCDGAARMFRFSGRGYRPTSRAQRAELIEKFLDAESASRPFDAANSELAQIARRPAIAPPLIDHAPERCQCVSDRQLPVGDRG
jgi:hypothetical protein